MNKKASSKKPKAKRKITMKYENSGSTFLEPLIKDSSTILSIINCISSLLNLNDNSESKEKSQLYTLCNELLNTNDENDEKQLPEIGQMNKYQANDLSVYDGLPLDGSNSFQSDPNNNLDSFNNGERNDLTSYNLVFHEEKYDKKKDEDEDDDMELYKLYNDMSKNPYIFYQIQTLQNKFKNYLEYLENKMIENHISPKDLFKPSKTYLIYNDLTKEIFCNLAIQYGVRTIASAFNLSPKTLRRWLKNGTKRKPGGGKKELYPKMEDILYQWIIQNKKQNIDVSSKNVKEKAKKLVSVDTFLASKGWLNKFKKKYHLDFLRRKKSLENI